MPVLESILEVVGLKAIICIPIALYLIKWTVQIAADPLRNVPGPFLSRYTRLWLMWQYGKGSFQQTNKKLHEKYGPVVRIAPNQYSLDDTDAAKILYGHGTNFTKSPWYITWGHSDPNVKNLFNDIDVKSHGDLRRKVASAYSMSSMVSYEPYVDECTTILLQRLSDFASAGVTFNMGQWFQFFAFDLIGKITFSKNFGFLESGTDMHGIIEQLDFAALYSSIVGLFPSWHQLLLSSLESLNKEAKGFTYVNNLGDQLLESRRHEEIQTEGPMDFLAKFLSIQRENPAKMRNDDIRVSISANIAAGSDTTSITLSAILYHLIKNGTSMVKLQEEIDAASKAGTISDPITFQEAQALPYLQAVIKEGLRIHPATGFTMPRIVPKGGREISGHYFPEGSTVGINPWVAHRNQEVFGSDADLFKPERWLEGKDASTRREAYYFSFGQGSRTCIGKNISLLEISKTIPQLVRHLEFHLENKGEWKHANHWFVKPRDFVCRVTKRKA